MRGGFQRSSEGAPTVTLHSFWNSIILLRLHCWNLGEDCTNIDPLATFCAFVQIALSIQCGKLFGERAADELIDGNALIMRQSLGVLVNGVGKSNAQCAHGRADEISSKSCGGVTTRTPNDDAPAKSEVLNVTRYSALAATAASSTISSFVSRSSGRQRKWTL